MKKALIIFWLVGIGLFGLYYFYTATLPSNFQTETLVLGHGGDGSMYLSVLDSKEGFEKAKAEGIDGTEMDVQMTADGVLVAFHASELERQTNCQGATHEFTWNELSNCELGSDPIQTIEQVLELGWKKGSVISLDLKMTDNKQEYRDKFLVALNTLTTKYGKQFQFLIETTDTDFLEQLKQLDVNAELFYYCTDISGCLDPSSIDFLDGISIDNKRISKQEVRLAQEKGMKVMIWGVGSRWDNRAAVLKSPELIQTDNIRHLHQLLKN